MKNMALISLLIIFILSGCATVGNMSYAEEQGKRITDSKTAFAYMSNPQFRDDQILFSGEGGSNKSDIFLINKNSDNLKNLTNTSDVNEYLAYWARGGKIVYQSNIQKRKGNYLTPDDFEVTSWIMDADGSNKQRISFDLYQSLGGYKGD